MKKMFDKFLDKISDSKMFYPMVVTCCIGMIYFVLYGFGIV